MKKILTIFLFLLIFAGRVWAVEPFKVTSVNFDTASQMIFLTSPDNTQTPIAKDIKVIELSSPKRLYFDLQNTILTTPKQDWFFNNSNLKEVKVAQTSTTPYTVRTVLYFDENTDTSKIKIQRINNNIVINLGGKIAGENYFQQIYRDERTSSKDFYQYMAISSEPLNQKTDLIEKKIEEAFKEPQTPIVKKDLHLNTNYYLDNVTMTPTGLLISGFGTVMLERPMILTEPSRIVYDIPNTLVNPQIRNKEIKLASGDTAKIGQFEVNKARIVITAEKVERYIPVFSRDSQTFLIVDSEKLNPMTLFENASDVIGYYNKKLDNTTSDLILVFNRPVVSAIDRDSNQITIYMYNVSRYSDETFKNTIKNTPLNGAKIDLMPKIGLKMTIPLDKNSSVKAFLGANAKSLELQVKSPNAKWVPSKQRVACKNTVVLDAGHGGADYGAIRAGINEKDITLDVAKRVQAILQKNGYKVAMTRDADETVSLENRVDFSEKCSPEVFVSIHVNSSVKTEPTGIETHYWRDDSITLAQTVHAKMISYIKSNDRGLFKSKFYVINHTTAPAILVEIGFISNDAERAQLVSAKRKAQTAKAIAEGVMTYLKQSK